MSFSTEIKKELSEIKNKKSCCRSSFLAGIFIDAEFIDNNGLTVSVTGEELRDIVLDSIRAVHKGEIDVAEETVLKMHIYRISIRSQAVRETLSAAEKSDDPISFFSNSICSDENCKKSLLRGAFLSTGTVNEPQKGYHLEFKLKKAERAAFVYRLLSDSALEPKIANRRSGSSVGLYYKNSTSIEDLLTYLGAVRHIFEFINTKIEREIRNSVNRSTNCVAGNISKSVKAAQNQVAAISSLESMGKLSLLPDELFETAKLRLENPSASLAELALMHEPPISKSGLTHRLAKIIELAEENN